MSGWRSAFSLSKDEVKHARPPGTVVLVEHELQRTMTGTEHNEDHIQLIPHPSASPADPLNWPMWRRLRYCSPCQSIAPAIPILAHEMLPPRSLGQLTHLVAVNVLALGVSNVFWVPLANIFGRRPIMLLAELILIAASIWAGAVNSFNSLLAARVVQGIGGGPGDTISPEILGEVFFVHQRGRAMAVYTIILASGSFVGGLCGGYIAGINGYKYIFWISAALSGFIFLCQFFLVPETLFDRSAHLSRQDAIREVLTEKINIAHVEIQSSPAPNDSFPIGQQLKVGIFRGNVIHHCVAPWLPLVFPGIWVVMLHYGGLLGGVAPQLLSMPPYLWGNNVGLINIAGVIGTFLGGAATYFVIDRQVTRTAKHERDGLAEPESRLPIMFPALFLAVTGMWTFGFSAQYPGAHTWAGLAVGFGMVSFSITQIPSVGFNYLIESYGYMSSNCFVLTTIIRAVVSFAWTYFVADWIEQAGAAEPFGIFGMIMAIFALLTVPLWLFGKRFRIMTASALQKQEANVGLIN
ncbi:hypothetical protein BAUCODRAFT_123934 [Baudoinia panamericana UAMH 10762]|uniref:Major facilitator superfamily (MFS) profile domain-containing protein n=1 Tax=Baudoinia panamericana (strain UAMH 10762) TaxID=717646 RepID=M2MFW5_BAUPA|nr:uncharacterized protein BAUCODRAFT_123934 [Baudoinia panamericana UAMH 10762]EMC95506.1 hypothetical protein BAUCODRAFT_123934 [Baudoinia panamericana UAMH 10762]